MTHSKFPGKIKFFDGRKGFGFVVDDQGRNYYFNRTHIPQGSLPMPDDPCWFDTGPTLSKANYALSR